MPFSGIPQGTLCLSEEHMILLLPLLKFAIDSVSGLFFIDRGAYPQKHALEQLCGVLKLDNISTYSYKVGQGTTLSLSPENELSQTIRHFIVQTKKIMSEGEISKIDALCLLIEQQRIPFLEDIMKVVAESKLEDINTIFGRIIHSQRNKEKFAVSIQPYTFCIKRSAFSDRLYQHLREFFPSMELNTENLSEFSNCFHQFIRDYVTQQANSFEFQNRDEIRELIQTLGVDLGNIVYVDENIGTGNTYAKALLFHKLMSTGDFWYMTVTGNKIGKVPSNYIVLSKEINVAEDVPEMFDCYYEGFQRITYKEALAHRLSLSGLWHSEQSYNLLCEQLDRLPQEKLRPIFQTVDRHLTLRKMQFSDLIAREIILYCINPTPINSLMILSIGHNYLLNFLRPFNEDKAFAELRQYYAPAALFHEVKIFEHLLKEHKHFLEKIESSSEIIRNMRPSILTFLKDSNLGSPVLSQSQGYVDILNEFYRQIDSKSILYDGF